MTWSFSDPIRPSLGSFEARGGCALAAMSLLVEPCHGPMWPLAGWSAAPYSADYSVDLSSQALATAD